MSCTLSAARHGGRLGGVLRRVFVCIAASFALASANTEAAGQPPAPSDPSQDQKPTSTPPAANDAAGKEQPNADAKADESKVRKAADKPIDQVTVTGTTQAYHSSIDRKSYSLAQDLQATTGSIADALRSIPAVDVDLQGNVSIRGDANVTVLVDGKPSALFQGQSRADILQQLPADQYERVEVITNPSAAFKADGTGGIINLITKKGRGAGFTGSVRVNAGDQGRYSTSVSLAYNTPALSLTGNLGARHDIFSYSGDTEEKIPNPVTGLLSGVHYVSANDAPQDSVNASGGVGLDPDAKDHLGASVQGFWGRFDNRLTSTYTSDAVTGPIALDYQDTGPSRAVFVFGAGSADFTHKFAGDDNQLSATLNYDLFSNQNDGRSTYIYKAPIQPNLYQDLDERDVDSQVDIKVEYKRPLAGGKLVAGCELQDDRDSFDHLGLLGTDAQDAAPSAAISNLFKIDQGVNDLYATYEHAFGAFAILPGLRLEDVLVDGDQTTSGQRTDLNYLEAYPTLHLSYTLSPSQKLTASYSRRVERPNLNNLNPFRIYEGPLDYQQGNPRLKPQITDSYELGYEFNSKSTTYSATLYYRDNHDSTTTLLQNIGNGVLLSTYDNLGESRNGGVEFVASAPLLKTLSYSLTGDVYWNQIDAANLGVAGLRSDVTGRVRFSLDWRPTRRDQLQATVQSSGDQLTPQGQTDGFTTVNLGYRHKIDDRFSMVFTVRDLFNTAGQHTIVDTPTLQQINTYSYHDRRFFLGFTFALGAVAGHRAPESFDFGGEGGAGAGPH